MEVLRTRPRGTMTEEVLTARKVIRTLRADIHYFDLNKWYWKLALVVLLFL